MLRDLQNRGRRLESLWRTVMALLGQRMKGALLLRVSR